MVEYEQEEEQEDKQEDKSLYIDNSNRVRSINKLHSITEFLYSINAAYRVYGGATLLNDTIALKYTIFIKNDLYELCVTISNEQTKITISSVTSIEWIVSISTNGMDHDEYFDNKDSFHAILGIFWTTKDIKGLIDLLKNVGFYKISV